ncbi:unnamed protein product [Pleuronectes platessa]|uniref:C-type lectin domain-containing protein n=1 Tax=Pleuronectes platessa TaxID=8262 RepID=A0A9N7VYK2_PLEPL|nr:unnamed protein product [Pleuronectes platessa]
MLTLAASYQEQKHRSSPELRPRIVSYCSAHSILTSVRKTQSEVTMDKNLPDASTTNRKLVVLSLGLLCILQAALNISLRLALYSSDAPDYDAVIKNLTEERDQLKRKLNTSDSSGAPDYDAVIRNLKEEGDQLKRMLKTFGWVYFRSSFYFISSDTKSWGDSRDDCLQKGADLVIINSKEENEFTRQFRRSFWIGLTDTETEGTWKWVDGTLLSTTTSYWYPGEPNPKYYPDENCGEARYNYDENNWNDNNCKRLYFWICEKKKSWGDSRDDCLQKGADLVIINSKEENEFTRQFRRLFWIGLTDTETEGTWKWVDGTLLSTSYWHPGEPNSYFSTDEDCGETKFNDLEYNWNDEQCSELNFWICEKSVA